MDQHPIPSKNSGDIPGDNGPKPEATDKESSYYYDDATGYEVYDPAADEDDDEMETPTANSN